jgi:hypothetical protein
VTRCIMGRRQARALIPLRHVWWCVSLCGGAGETLRASHVSQRALPLPANVAAGSSATTAALLSMLPPRIIFISVCARPLARSRSLAYRGGAWRVAERQQPAVRRRFSQWPACRAIDTNLLVSGFGVRRGGCAH